MPEPSPITKPSRSRSNGREARAGSSLRVESARMEQNPPTPRGVMAASLPPAIITSASPRWMSRKESPIAWALVVQAVQVAEFGPLAPGADGDPARGQVHDGGGDEEGADLRAARRFMSVGVLALDGGEPADAAADVDARPLGVRRASISSPASVDARSPRPPPRTG